MPDIIQLLSDHVANQIAAGEVVQRPASVVKELLENAIDAQASSIKLIIKEAGKTLIQVIDDGIGMSATDARMSVERHATSKITSADDLFKLQTKGFRGEALASIAAIAHLEIKTKTEAEDIGTQLIVEGSKVKAQEASVTPKGTSISVKNLFFNIPARRNFLKSNTVELRHIIDEFHRVALAHPDIRFSFFHNKSELFQLPKGNFRQRIVHIFGNKINDKLVPVEEATEIIEISGFVGKPEYSKKTRSEQFFLVNDRFIKSAYLNHAINTAYDGLLKPGYHPSFFLNLKVNPESIDINIHPTKTEIKFDDEQSLYAILRSAVKHSLGQFQIAPILDFEHQQNLETPYNYQSKEATTPKIEVDHNYNPFESDSSTQTTSKKNQTVYRKPQTESWESLYVGLESKVSKDEFSPQTFEFESKGNDTFIGTTHATQTNRTVQLDNKFVLSLMATGVLVIHQNRAHQRILYEQFLKSLTLKDTLSQQLLFPSVLTLSKTDVNQLKTVKEDLEIAGFQFSKFENETVEITALPVGVDAESVKEIFNQLIFDITENIPKHNFSVADMIAKSLAKSLSIKTGQQLNEEEQEHLVNSLFACKAPNISPTNKKCFIKLNADDLSKKFE